jgi:hypothetical protein
VRFDIASIHCQVMAADDASLWTRRRSSIFPGNRAGIALHRSARFRTLAMRSRIARHPLRLARHRFVERRRDDDR